MDHNKWKFKIGGMLLILVGLWRVFGFVMTIEFASFYFSIRDIGDIIITLLMLYLGYIMIKYSWWTKIMISFRLIEPRYVENVLMAFNGLFYFEKIFIKNCNKFLRNLFYILREWICKINSERSFPAFFHLF